MSQKSNYPPGYDNHPLAPYSDEDDIDIDLTDLEEIDDDYTD